jgi:hypothetical protein
MKRFGVLLLLTASVAPAIHAQVDLQKVATDAAVIDRVAEASKKDLPRDLLKRIIAEDIEALRGRRADGSYDFARYERLEAGRIEQDFSIQPRENDDKLQMIEIRGPYVYRLIVTLPSRRMMVTKNRKIWLDRVDLEYVADGSPGTKTQSVKVEAWLDPGTVRPFELPEVARQATVRVYARADKEAGYGNVVLTLVQARVVDEPDSPHADVVASAKAVQRALENGDIPSIRAMASRMRDMLRTSDVPVFAPPARTIEVRSTPLPPLPNGLEPTPAIEIYLELQSIEDLLTGTADERREGIDKLHQLVRKLRPGTAQR